MGGAATLPFRRRPHPLLWDMTAASPQEPAGSSCSLPEMTDSVRATREFLTRSRHQTSGQRGRGNDGREGNRRSSGRSLQIAPSGCRGPDAAIAFPASGKPIKRILIVKRQRRTELARISKAAFFIYGYRSLKFNQRRVEPLIRLTAPPNLNRSCYPKDLCTPLAGALVPDTCCLRCRSSVGRLSRSRRRAGRSNLLMLRLPHPRFNELKRQNYAPVP